MPHASDSQRQATAPYSNGGSTDEAVVCNTRVSAKQQDQHQRILCTACSLRSMVDQSHLQKHGGGHHRPVAV